MEGLRKIIKQDPIIAVLFFTFLGFCLGGIVGREVEKVNVTKSAPIEKTNHYYVETKWENEYIAYITYDGVSTIVDTRIMAENNATMEDVVIELVTKVKAKKEGK